MKLPQILMIVLLSISLLSNAYYHGKPKEGNYNFWMGFLSNSILVGLLLWGGYFN